MIIEYALASTDYDTVNKIVTYTWQYEIPHSPEILGTFVGTEAELQVFLQVTYPN